MSKKPYLDCSFQSDADSSLLCSGLVWSGLVWSGLVYGREGRDMSSSQLRVIKTKEGTRHTQRWTRWIRSIGTRIQYPDIRPGQIDPICCP